MGPLEKLAALKVWWWAQREGKGLMLSFIGPTGKVLIAAVAAALGTVDMANILPPQYDNMLEGFVFLLLSLTGTPTKQAAK